ncbi:TadE/TadG family type IV pilus assembly protein [Nitratireductor luteus]|uniref:TadE/TadG family type IV pilus assembly protein n=1 Tax=Nitratireductor luteus TaxID=2976980 RepID=UPI00223FC5A6|nr:TadE/TadG family type IV pilus assembly protein [Nitratireductor luteus]
MQSPPANTARRPRKIGVQEIRSFLFRNEEGVSALEFAIFTPILALLLGAGIDLGLMLHSQFSLNSMISLSANQAFLNRDMVDDANGETLAKQIIAVLAGTGGKLVSEATVVVNNGPTARLEQHPAVMKASSGSADSCYCPTGSGSSFSWGKPTGCGEECGDGNLSGKYVMVTARSDYEPFFIGFGYTSAQALQASAVVRTQ